MWKTWRSRQRNEAVRLFGRRILLLGLFMVVIVAASGVWNIARKERESTALRAEAESQLAALESRQRQLDADIKKLKTDRGMEEALREQYSLAKEGEDLIVIVDPATTAPPAEPKASVLDRIRGAFSWW